MPEEAYVGVWQNVGITGTIPAGYARNNGTYFDIGETSIGGCVPKGLNGYFVTFQTRSDGTRVLDFLPSC
jgi:hypothetical protein